MACKRKRMAAASVLDQSTLGCRKDIDIKMEPKVPMTAKPPSPTRVGVSRAPLSAAARAALLFMSESPVANARPVSVPAHRATLRMASKALTRLRSLEPHLHANAGFPGPVSVSSEASLASSSSSTMEHQVADGRDSSLPSSSQQSSVKMILQSPVNTQDSSYSELLPNEVMMSSMKPQAPAWPRPSFKKVEGEVVGRPVKRVLSPSASFTTPDTTCPSYAAAPTVGVDEVRGSMSYLTKAGPSDHLNARGMDLYQPSVTSEKNPSWIRDRDHSGAHKPAHEIRFVIFVNKTLSEFFKYLNNTLCYQCINIDYCELQRGVNGAMRSTISGTESESGTSEIFYGYDT